MKILTKGFSAHPRRRNMSPNAIHSQHQQRENNALPELGNPEYILKSGEHGLDHLCLAAGGLDFVQRALAELVRANRQCGFQLADAEHLYSSFEFFH